MTATIPPTQRDRRDRPKPIRLSYLESLGFTDAVVEWSDSPDLSPVVIEAAAPSLPHRGRHEAGPDPIAGWAPSDASRLQGSNIRWGLMAFLALVIAGLAFGGVWLYQRPGLQRQAVFSDLNAQAERVEMALPGLEAINAALTAPAVERVTAPLTAVETEARSLFQISGSLPQTESVSRGLAADVASTALDASRLLGEAIAYRQAVLPILAQPELETDPTLIELDEAARAFGAWQLRVDDVRTALPSGVLAEVTEQLDVLSGDLPGLLSGYIDALREDDAEAAGAVIREIGGRLGDVESRLMSALAGVQERVSDRLEDTRDALRLLIG